MIFSGKNKRNIVKYCLLIFEFSNLKVKISTFFFFFYFGKRIIEFQDILVYNRKQTESEAKNKVDK